MGIRVQDLLRPRHPPAEARDLVLREKNQVLTKVYNRRAIDVDAVVAEYLAYGERLAPYLADTCLILNQALDDGQDRAARGRPGDAARRRPRHLPVRHLVLADRGRRVRRVRHRADPDHQVIGIVKAYTTRVGSGPFPTELTDEQRRVAAQDRRRVRRHDRPGAPVRLVRRGHRPVRDPGQRDHRLLRDQAGRAVRAGRRCRSAWPTTWTAPGIDEMPMTQTEFHHAVPVYEYLDGWSEDISAAHAASATCPPTAQAYVQAHRGDDRRPGRGGRRRPAPGPDPPAPPAGLSGVRPPRTVPARGAARR